MLHAKDILVELSRKNKPFFLTVGLDKPYLPFTAPKKYRDQYNRDDTPLDAFRGTAENSPRETCQSGGEIKKYCDIPPVTDYSMSGMRLPDEKQTELIHGYYAAVTYADALVGRLMDSLRDLKLTDSTIVVIAGDHGWHLGDHNLWCKHTNLNRPRGRCIVLCLPGKRGAKRMNWLNLLRSIGINTPLLAAGRFIDIFPTRCGLSHLRGFQTLTSFISLPHLRAFLWDV